MWKHNYAYRIYNCSAIELFPIIQIQSPEAEKGFEILFFFFFVLKRNVFA